MRTPTTTGEAARALEATLLRQMLAASGAFRGSDAAGAQIHADMFVEVLADAVASRDGLGIAAVLTRSLPDAQGGGGETGGAAQAAADLAPFGGGELAAPGQRTTGTPLAALNAYRGRAEVLIGNERKRLSHEGHGERSGP